MRRRLYFIFPALAEVKECVDKLLLQRIDIKHIHVHAREGIEIGDLPEATVFQKCDIMHSVLLGLMAGGVLGIVVGIIAHHVLDVSLGGGMIVMTIFGALLGAWAASMVGLMTTNAHIKKFEPKIKNDHLLLMVNVPKEQVEAIETMVLKRYPQAKDAGVEPTIPGFP